MDYFATLPYEKGSKNQKDSEKKLKCKENRD